MLKNFLLVFFGGGTGALARYCFMLLIARFTNYVFLSTFFVNVFGSFLIGLLFGYFWRENNIESLRLLFAIGFLGGFTTFSAFSFDFFNLWIKGEWTMAIAYAISSVFFSLLAIFLAVYLLRQ